MASSVCLAEQNPKWSIDCETTGLVKWNFNESDRSASKLWSVDNPNSNHQLYLSEEGDRFETTNSRVGVFIFSTENPQDVSVSRTREKLSLIFYGPKYGHSLPYFYELDISKKQLRMETHGAELNMNYVALNNAVSGMQRTDYNGILHTFECKNISEEKWTALFNEMNKVADDLLMSKKDS